MVEKQSGNVKPFVALPLDLFMTDIPGAALKIYGILYTYGAVSDGIIKLSQEELAELCGVSYRSFCRYIKELKNIGLITMHRKRISVSAIACTSGYLPNMAVNGPLSANSGGPLLVYNQDIINRIEEMNSAKNGKQGDTPVDWKKGIANTIEQQKQDAAPYKARKVARRRDKAKTSVASRVGELESKPVERWGPKDFVTYFHKQYYELHPSAGYLSPSKLVGKKGAGQLGMLLDYLTVQDKPIDLAVEDAARRLKALIDHVCDEWPRISAGLKWTGDLSPGKLLGFKDALIADAEGRSEIKTDSRATRGQAGREDSKPLKTTSKWKF